MVRATPLERLYELDKAFAAQLDRLLHDERYISQLMGLQEDGLIQVVDYLSDTIRRLIRVRQSPRKCLHILYQISSTRKVLPPDYEVSGSLSPGSGPSAYGGSGEVHRGSLSVGKEDVCIKKFKIQNTGERENIDQLLREEAILWKYLHHPNIVPFKGVTLEPPQLVSEWMPGGELREYLKKDLRANSFSLLLGVADGLEYLHSHGVIHGDLKGPNILVDAFGNARITDFGLASIFRDPHSVRRGAEEYGYTTRWAAPEMFGKNPSSSKESDVYSFAMVAIEVFSGEVPFYGTRSTAVPGIVKKGGRPERPVHPSLTDPLWNLILKCWEQTAKARPEMRDVIDELKRIKNLPPSKKPTEEPRVLIPGPSQILGYDAEAPLPKPTPPTLKVRGQGDRVPKDTKVIGGGATRKLVSRPHPTPRHNDLPTNDPEIGVEGHEYRAPPKEAKEDKDPRHLGSRKVLEPGRKLTYAEMAAKAKLISKEGQPDPPGSAAALPPQTNTSCPTTPGPSARPPPKEEGKLPPMSKETNIFGGEIIDKPAPRLPPTVGNNPLASGSRVTLEGRREPRAPPNGVKEDEDRKELERKQSRRDRPQRKQNEGEEAAKEAKDAPEDGPHNPSGSTTVVDSWINVVPSSPPPTPKPSPRRDNTMAIPPMPGSSTHIDIEQPFHPLTLPPNLGGRLSVFPAYLDGSPEDRFSQIAAVHAPTTMGDDQPRGQSSGPSAVLHNPNPVDVPRISDKSIPQIRNHPQTDNRKASPPSQVPAPASPAVHETPEEVPSTLGCCSKLWKSKRR